MTSETTSGARPPSRAVAVAAIVLVSIAVLAGLTWVWMQEREARAIARVGEEWQRLATCLVGDPMIDDRAPVLRRAALRAATDRAPVDDAWPMRCGAHRDALESALEDVGAESYPALRVALGEASALWSTRPAGLPPRIEYAAIDALFTAASAEHLPRTPATDAVPPALAAPVSMRDAASLRAEEPTTDDLPGGDLRLLLPRDVCTIHASAPTAIACHPLGGTLQGSGFRTTRLIDAEDGAEHPIVLVGSVFEAESGVFDARSGERIVVPAQTYDATQRADDVATLSIADERVLLGTSPVPPDPGRPARDPEPLAGVDPAARGHDPSAPQLAGDALVWLAGGHLFARELDASVPTDLGATTIESIPMNVGGCRAGELLAIDLDGGVFLLRSGAAWSIARLEGPAEASWAGRAVARACDDEGVSAITTTWDETGRGRTTTLTEVRCTANRCARDEVALPELGPLVTAPVAVRLGDRVLLAFHRAAADGADAGVRMRLAPLRELASAPEVVIFDPLEQEPTRDATAGSVRLAVHARGDSAWVLVFRNGAWLPIAVAADGTYQPVLAAAPATPPAAQ